MKITVSIIFVGLVLATICHALTNDGEIKGTVSPQKVLSENTKVESSIASRMRCCFCFGRRKREIGSGPFIPNSGEIQNTSSRENGFPIRNPRRCCICLVITPR